MAQNIAVIRGDGIGPEIVEQAKLVLDRVAVLFGHEFRYMDVDMGGNAIDKWGDPLPQAELDKCLNADSVLLGAGGGPKWNGVPGHMRPEKGLLRLRAGMGVYSNNRPAKIWPQLASASPLKQEIVDKGIDFIIVRELIGGIYFGKHETVEENGEKTAIDELRYSESEIRRIGRIGFENFRYPSQFDVIVTENMFGDILSDEASMITGSIGMIPSSSLGDGTRGLYEPIHGSAPDIAGKDIANPIGTILAAAMMLRYSFDMAEEADCIESAVSAVLDGGYRTGDILPSGGHHCHLVGCREMGSLVIENLKKG